jgi:DNA-directed RNA polymerase beta' subunit
MVIAGYCPRIARIQIHLSDNTDNQNISATNVTKNEQLETSGEPIRGGLYDPRMGAIINNCKCSTCQHKPEKCPGHFGIYDLQSYVVSQPVAQDDIIKWLKVVCLKCGTLLTDLNKLKGVPNSRKLQTASSQGTTAKCPVCGEKHPTIKPNAESIFYVDVMRGEYASPEVMKMADIWHVLQKISDESCIAMGRSIESHPRKYYFNKMIVPPITIRPVTKTGNGSKQRQSPLNEFIKQIMRKAMLSLPTQDKKDENHLFINKCIYDMIRAGSLKKGETRTQNIIGGQLNNALLKSWSGKTGRIRNQLLGHRSLNTARITISGNAGIRTEQLGVPLYVANTLQIPETVRHYNIEKLMEYVINGKCSKIKKHSDSGISHSADDAIFKSINSVNKDSIILEYGDVVYRDLMDGDDIVFNRQPSLMGSSMSALKAVIASSPEQNTFEMNVGACIWYNADFDGDQMTAKALASLLAIAEARILTAASNWLLSGQLAVATSGQVQDAVVGSALLTQDGVVLDKLHTMRLFAKTGITDINFDQPTYTGREIISLLLKRTPVTYRGKAAFYNASYASFIPYKQTDIDVVIEKGEIKSGVIDKATIGQNSHGGIFHLIALIFGPQTALDVVYQYQQIIMAYLYMRGFTMSLSDLIIKPETKDVIDRTISDKMAKSTLYANKLVKGQIYPPMGVSIMDHYETQQLRILGGESDILGPILSDIDKGNNGLYQMIIYGAKGKPNHMVEMMGTRGSVTLEGKRMPLNFSFWRSSSYYPRFALNSQSRGFVRESLVVGLTPPGITFAAQSSRQQLVQKSQSTSLTGSNQRKHVKNMDNTITNNLYQTHKSQMMIQLLYGEDGFAPQYLIRQTLDSVFMSDDDIRSKYLYTAKDKKHQSVFDAWMANILDDRDEFRKTMNVLDMTNLQYKGYTNKIMSVIYTDHVIDTYFNDGSKPLTRNEKDLVTNVNMVAEFIDTLPYIYTNHIQRKRRIELPKYLTTAIRLTQMLLRLRLNPIQLQYTTIALLDQMTNDLTIMIMSKLIPGGSCVGILAAQYLGEPMTQAMLDAVHGASSGARAGLEANKEILGARYATPYTDGMIIRLADVTVASDKSKVDDLANRLKRVKLTDIYKSWQIFLEDLGDPVHPKYKHEKTWLQTFIRTHPSDSGSSIGTISRWVIRVELDKKMMIYKSISVETIVEALYRSHSKIYIAYTTEKDKDVVVRIYLMEALYANESNVANFIHTVFLHRVLNTTIRGISNILETTVQPYQSHRINPSNGAMDIKTEYLIKTVGEDIRGITSTIAIAHDDNPIKHIDIDSLQIATVMSTLEIFGIEAARMRVIEQLIATLEGKHPEYHHLSVYADIITWSGAVKSIERGIYQEKNKTLPAMSGYGAGKTIISAALQGVDESTDNVSAPILLGTIPKIGTNYNNYLMDEAVIMEQSQNVVDMILG